jgi:hypothetical protein
MSNFGFDFNTYSTLIGERESKNDYKRTNRGGYLGRYQLGAQALIDAGYVKPGTKQAGLKNPANWVIGNRNEFLYNPEFQDDAFYKYTQKNYQYAQNKGLIKPEDDPTHVAGVLAGSHLVGVNDFKRSLKNPNITDGNGVTPGTYYDYVKTNLEKAAMPVVSQDELKGTVDYLRGLFKW